MRPSRLIPLIVVIFAALVILPNVIAAAQGFQLTMKNKLNVRSGPGTKYTILGTLAKGDVVDAIAPQLVGSPPAIDHTARRLADFAQAMVQAEQQRRQLVTLPPSRSRKKS